MFSHLKFSIKIPLVVYRMFSSSASPNDLNAAAAPLADELVDILANAISVLFADG